MTKEQKEKAYRLKSIIFDYCRNEMSGKGCKNCIIGDMPACVADFPTIESLQKAVNKIQEVRGE